MSPTERAPEVRETAADVSVAGQMVEASLEDLDQRVEPLQTVAERERDRAVLWQDPGGFMNDQAEGFSDYTTNVSNNFQRGGDINLVGSSMAPYRDPGNLAMAGAVGGIAMYVDHANSVDNNRMPWMTGGITAGLVMLEGGVARDNPLEGGPIRRLMEPATETVVFTALDSIPRGGYNLARGLGMSNVDAMVVGGGVGLGAVGTAAFQILKWLHENNKSDTERRAKRIENNGKLSRRHFENLQKALDHEEVGTLGALNQELDSDLLQILGLAELGGILAGEGGQVLGSRRIDAETFQSTRDLLIDPSRSSGFWGFMPFRSNRSAVDVAVIRNQFLQDFKTWIEASANAGGATERARAARESLVELASSAQASASVTNDLQRVANHFQLPANESNRAMRIRLAGNNPALRLTDFPIRMFTGGRVRNRGPVTPQNIYERFAGEYNENNEQLTSGFDFEARVTGEDRSKVSFRIGYANGTYYLRRGDTTYQIDGFEAA